MTTPQEPIASRFASQVARGGRNRSSPMQDGPATTAANGRSPLQTLFSLMCLRLPALGWTSLEKAKLPVSRAQPFRVFPSVPEQAHGRLRSEPPLP